MAKGNKISLAVWPIVEACKDPNNCGFGDFLVLLGRIFNFFIWIAVPLTALIIAYGGFLYLISATNEGKRSQAKHTIWNAVIGLAITLAAYLIVKSLLQLIGADSTFTDLIK